MCVPLTLSDEQSYSDIMVVKEVFVDSEALTDKQSTVNACCSKDGVKDRGLLQSFPTWPSWPHHMQTSAALRAATCPLGMHSFLSSLVPASPPFLEGQGCSAVSPEAAFCLHAGGCSPAVIWTWIVCVPPLRNVHDVQQFLRLGNYIKHYIQGYAKLVAPSRKLTEKSAFCV